MSEAFFTHATLYRWRSTQPTEGLFGEGVGDGYDCNNIFLRPPFEILEVEEQNLVEIAMITTEVLWHHVRMTNFFLHNIIIFVFVNILDYPITNNLLHEHI